jgi:hypothetical protein
MCKPSAALARLRSGPSGPGNTENDNTGTANLTTTSTAYTPLVGGATTSATVVGAGHKAIVTVSTNCANSSNNNGCFISFTANNGASPGTAADARAAGVESMPTATHFSGSGTYVVTLASGTTTFTANYRSTIATGTATFAASSIVVQVY